MTPRLLTKQEMDLLKELRWKMDGIKDDFEREVFKYICFQFQEYKRGLRETKQVTKEQILRYLASIGLVNMRADGSLPDDRKVREAARELLKRGLPIVASAHRKGYFVAETPAELDATMRENKSRVKALLDVDKGCETACALLMGQGRIFG